MSAMLPVALYGLKVPAGDVMVPAVADFPATFHITMAALDPSANAERTGSVNGHTPARATLKILYAPTAPEADDDSDLDSEDAAMQMQQLLGAASDDDDDDESSSDGEDENGGPSDPTKSKKARKIAAAVQMLKALAQEDSDEDREDTTSSPVANGLALNKNKGKAKAKTILAEEDASDEDEEDDDEAEETVELVLCTLDPDQHFQQTLNITIPEGQRTFFKVSGTHAVYLTGNYVIPPDTRQDGGYDEDEGDLGYDMSPDEDELEGDLDDEENDELDNLEDPRITELESEEDEAPKLVKSDKAKDAEKGKNKRKADDLDEEAVTLDAIMDKSLRPAEPSTNMEPKLSKKQKKKLKNNAGKAVETTTENTDPKEDPSPAKADKKVQFAKNLEQGPTNTTREVRPDANQSKEDAKAGKKENPSQKSKATLGPKTLGDGVKIDDKKLGTGPTCKKGDKIGMRFIGKLENGEVFRANKKGPPFTFTLGGDNSDNNRKTDIVEGWHSGIPGMSVGGERRVVVPARLAYGNKASGSIPANAQLTFDVKLLSIK